MLEGSGEVGNTRQAHVFETMDPDGGGNGSVVTGMGGPRHASEIVVPKQRIPLGGAVIDYGHEHTQMVGEGGPANGQV